MTEAWWAVPIEDQVAAIDRGAVTAETLSTQIRNEVTQHEEHLHAWVSLSGAALSDARRLDVTPGSLPLRGVSVGVKDLIDVAGMPTRAGSSVTSREPAGSDAACVARLRDLGAIVQGKTVTTEFGYFSPGPTHNPHAHGHTPGGSSSGSASAVGAGTIPLALGTQTAGSLTRPASFCGAAGMVFAAGTTSLAGVTGLSPTLDSLGMLTRSVTDLRYVVEAFTGTRYEPLARRTRPMALTWSGSDLGEVEPDMRRLLDEVPQLIARAGLGCAQLEWDDHVQTLSADHLVVMAHEAADTLNVLHDTSHESLSPQLRDLVAAGRATSDHDHTHALLRRDRSRALLENMLDGGTVIVGPGALGPAPAGLSATGSPVLSRPWQLLGLPVITVPGGRTSSGLPLGLQVIGLPGHESVLFDAAIAIESAIRLLPPQPA
ncbi:amidase [Williamsia phyllosphaerae]|uniref:amidase n=1 Tax=Williamsia phyllosphaerae TaxID=885042 RepID=A0ABQ1U835_9NOCA|nr:amidase [Williamsia phyllosphaerae]GGF11419.1 amidase [Williamsia phyllosphaerae]